LLQLQWQPANGHLRLFKEALEWDVTRAECPKSSRAIEVNVPNGAGHLPNPLTSWGLLVDQEPLPTRSTLAEMPKIRTFLCLHSSHLRLKVSQY
jgi:hypothetical protein